MDDFRNVFINNSSNDYDSIFNKNINIWENSLLNENTEELYNYKLEEDLSFINSSLHLDKEIEFNPINQMFIHGNIKNINKINTWNLITNYNSVNKPFFRFILKPNLSDLDIKNFLNILIDSSIEYIIGGSLIIKIEKILFNFLICKKLNKPINKLNVKEFLQ